MKLSDGDSRFAGQASQFVESGLVIVAMQSPSLYDVKVLVIYGDDVFSCPTKLWSETRLLICAIGDCFAGLLRLME